MSAIGPKLPLMTDDVFGSYSLVTEYKDEIQQNLKNLLLTAPGERVMIPEFGVGLRNFLFEPRQHSIVQIRQRIQNQITRYMPFIRNSRVMFDHSSDDEYLENSNVLSITISYEVPNLNLSSTLILSREDVN
jgi:phage baseplate assembly protein W